jgi:hypothetical protein
MNKIISSASKFAAFALLMAMSAYAVSLESIFDYQKKSAFPDTCEMQIRTTVTLPGQLAQVVNTAVLTAGESKSSSTIKSSMVQMKMVQNDGRMKVIDLKTGKQLPAQNVPAQNPSGVNKQMGVPADYNAPVKEGNLWKLTPKDAAKPTLYYSEKAKRVVKMITPVQGATAESLLEYCDNSCPLPGSLKKVTITTTLAQGGTSTVVMEILMAKQRHAIPMRIFDVE